MSISGCAAGGTNNAGCMATYRERWDLARGAYSLGTWRCQPWDAPRVLDGPATMRRAWRRSALSLESRLLDRGRLRRLRLLLLLGRAVGHRGLHERAALEDHALVDLERRRVEIALHAARRVDLDR